MLTFKNKDSSVKIELRQADKYSFAWALFVNEKYIRTKVLPRNNAAVVQNFGYAGEEFTLFGV